MTPEELQDKTTEFLREYCADDIAQLSFDAEAVWIDHENLFSFDPVLADAVRENPKDVLPEFEASVGAVDTTMADSPDHAPVRIYNLPEPDTYAPGAIRSQHGEQLVTIRGTLERITTTSDTPEEVCFECVRCGAPMYVPQDTASGELQQPTECKGCERKGPFDIQDSKTVWNDYAKLRIESRPDVTDENDGKITGYVLNDLIDVGGDTGLLERAGEPVKVTGIVERVQKSGRGENELLFDHHLDVRGIEFERDNETVEIAEHKETFEELAASPDAIDKFAASIAPQLHETDAWESAMEFAVAYLFGAPRIDLQDGPTYRGDLHFLIVSDYGMGKSTFKEDIQAYSPKCLSKSTTALSSGVGLTAAAVKDDFGEGQWTIKPGLLVRANGGHLILDEIDKGPDELTEMNDALEGDQVVDVERAGKSATYHSRTAVMALGNPVDGRFDENQSVAAQLGIKESLLSRFDGIVTMRDTVDKETDEAVAETFGQAYTEAQKAEIGEGAEFNVLERPVPIDVGQAWIKHARENVNPTLEYDTYEELKEWYAEDVRQLNHSFAGDSGDGSDMPAPATVRELAAAVKMSIAFARVELCETVQPRHIDRAKNLGKRLVKQNWDGEKFDAGKNKRDKSQKKKIDRVVAEIEDTSLTASEIAENVRMEYDRVKRYLKQDPRTVKTASNKWETK
jgi:replicative DNA helicase Mcm